MIVKITGPDEDITVTIQTLIDALGPPTWQVMPGGRRLSLDKTVGGAAALVWRIGDRNLVLTKSPFSVRWG